MRSALLVALLVLLAAPAAHAERAVVRDGRGDVFAESVSTAQAEPSPVDRPDTDLGRVLVDHRAGAVVVRSRLGGVPRGDVEGLFFVDVRTDAGLWVQASGSYGRGGTGEVTFFAPPTAAVTECPQARFRLRPGGPVRLDVPRGCLGDPRWVQVRVAATTVVEGTQYVDIAGTDRRSTRVWTRRLHAG